MQDLSRAPTATHSQVTVVPTELQRPTGQSLVDMHSKQAAKSMTEARAVVLVGLHLGWGMET